MMSFGIYIQPMTTSTGLRERKKLKIRRLIQREAFRLFHDQGYEETTIEQIAAAAEVSASTFFRYFATKEDVVLTDDYDPLLQPTIENRPPNELPLETMRNAICGMLKNILKEDREEILERISLVLRVPTLQARYWQEHQRMLHQFAGQLAARTGRADNEFGVRIAAAVLLGALLEAEFFWAEHGGEDSLVELIERAFQQIGDSLKL
jgi:AcrR family transcriptional regulator